MIFWTNRGDSDGLTQKAHHDSIPGDGTIMLVQAHPAVTIKRERSGRFQSGSHQGGGNRSPSASIQVLIGEDESSIGLADPADLTEGGCQLSGKATLGCKRR